MNPKSGLKFNASSTNANPKLEDLSKTLNNEHGMTRIEVAANALLLAERLFRLHPEDPQAKLGLDVARAEMLYLLTN